MQALLSTKRTRQYIYNQVLRKACPELIKHLPQQKLSCVFHNNTCSSLASVSKDVSEGIPSVASNQTDTVRSCEVKFASSSVTSDHHFRKKNDCSSWISTPCALPNVDYAQYFNSQDATWFDYSAESDFGSS